jgi:hypothetical protein
MFYYWLHVSATQKNKEHTIRGAAHTKGHREAAIRRQKKSRRSQNIKIENIGDVHQRVLLTCEHSAVGSIKMCCLKMALWGRNM